ncbi:hypothetical protein J8273_4226 [Carpediemonas membranifera]|uniref:Calponin-homology (CH) domain-containing protein n=1 Tax=Carpediemonas membranifera TaxID=201153 RepID=A0A8J6B6J2_9EUKA|nr:hypothetical protein J8273_4226 [Carpediemonas membranifera]|eukprot:KAG9394124.1 hypothetical protein J8273_4226 [Carpediemonas membranifera]
MQNGLKLTESDESITFKRGDFQIMVYANKSKAVGEFIMQSDIGFQLDTSKTVVSQLTTGAALCNLWNKYFIDAQIEGIHENKEIISAHRMYYRQNIENFLDACIDTADMDKNTLFEVNDLAEQANPRAVIDALFALFEKIGETNEDAPKIQDIQRDVQQKSINKEETEIYRDELEAPAEKEPERRERTPAVEPEPEPEVAEEHEQEAEEEPAQPVEKTEQPKGEKSPFVGLVQRWATETATAVVNKAMVTVQNTDKEDIKREAKKFLANLLALPTEVLVTFFILVLLLLVLRAPAEEAVVEN